MLLYAIDLILMSERFGVLGNRFTKWKVFVGNGLKVNLRKSKVIVSGSIARDGLSKSKVELCWSAA